MKRINLALILILLLFPVLAFAHPGRTDSYGCHTCRTNCSSWGLSAGEYHCHNAKALPQPEEPIKSTYGEGGTGYVQPAPEYKNPTPSAPINNTVNDSVPVKPRVESTKSSQVLGVGYNEPATPEGDDGLVGWVVGLGAAGAGGYWLAKRKK